MEARQSGAGRVPGSTRTRLQTLQAVLTAARHNPRVDNVAALNVSLEPLFPWNRWLHRMLPQLARALQVNFSSSEWRANRSFSPQLQYLVPNGAFSSNPCAGSSCMLNPFYELLPRDAWVVESNICQSAADFVLDHATGSICCPSPDYCCPNSVANCSRPEAILFDATNVPASTLAHGWRKHYFARFRTRGPEKLCNASAWNGAASYPDCFWTMNEQSVARVKKVWSQASPIRVTEDDDDTHNWRAAGAPTRHDFAEGHTCNPWPNR